MLPSVSRVKARLPLWFPHLLPVCLVTMLRLWFGKNILGHGDTTGSMGENCCVASTAFESDDDHTGDPTLEISATENYYKYAFNVLWGRYAPFDFFCLFFRLWHTDPKQGPLPLLIPPTSRLIADPCAIFKISEIASD